MPKNRPSKEKRDAEKHKEFRLLRQRRDREKQDAAKRVCDDESLDFAAKIDELAIIRHWFTSDTTTIDKYMSGELKTAETVEILAKPVDDAYSSADYGWQWYYQEKLARSQRKYHTPEKALERWGPEEDWPEPEGEDRLPSAELLLWDLWYSILHAAKRIPYTDDARHGKLVELVQALKDRPDPPQPVPMTVPLQKSWIWESGKLWTDLTVLGISVAEVSNDSPGCGAGWLRPEYQAWENLNYFMARLTASNVATLQNYAIWALSDAMERTVGPGYRSMDAPPDAEILGHYVIVASLWVTVAGDKVFADFFKVRDKRDIEVVDRILDLRDDKLPWRRSKKKYKNRARWETARMEFYRRRFEVESRNEGFPLEVRELASKAAEAMVPFVQFEETDKNGQ